MRLRRAEARLDGTSCGVLEEYEQGTRFTYNTDYLSSSGAVAISLTLPMREEPFLHARLHPFFENLLPEGWLLDITTAKLKVQADDVFGLLLATCRDCIGAVEILPLDTEGDQ